MALVNCLLVANKTDRTDVVDLKKLPDNMKVKLSFSTKYSEKENNKFLGYSNFHYHSKKEKEFIRNSILSQFAFLMNYGPISTIWK